MSNPFAKRLRHALCLAAALLSTTFAQAAVDVGVGITIREPGVYGRIEIGSAPPPALIYPQPVVVVPAPVPYRPIYMYVPPGHAKDWKHYCKRYAACNQPVYFVREDWVRDRYDHYHYRDHRRDRYDRDRRDDRRDRGHPGRGRGNGKGHVRD